MIVLFGVEGCGKNTILSSLLEDHMDFNLIDYNSLFFEMAKIFCENNQQVINLDRTQIKKINQKVFEQLIFLNNEKTILNISFLIDLDLNLFSFFLIENLKKLNLSHIFLICSPTNEIFERIKKEINMEKKDALEKIKIFQLKFIDILNNLKEKNFKTKIIYNEDGKINQTKQELKNYILQIFKKDIFPICLNREVKGKKVLILK